MLFGIRDIGHNEAGHAGRQQNDNRPNPRSASANRKRSPLRNASPKLRSMHGAKEDDRRSKRRSA
jgi:hypothetical protein